MQLRSTSVARAVLGSAVAVSLLAGVGTSSAQQSAEVRRIGMLRSAVEPPDGITMRDNLRAFWSGLGEHGFVEGQNARIEYRFPASPDARLEDLAAELVRLRVDVIHAAGPGALRAARHATRTLPIVAHDYETDPVADGFVASLARPGGNVTGMFLDLPELAGKWLELLREAVPRLSSVAVLWDPATGAAQRRAMEDGATRLRLAAHVVEVRSPAEHEEAFKRAVAVRAGALLALSSPVFGGAENPRRIAELALLNRLPSIMLFPSFVDRGGLMSYGPASSLDLYRLEARLVAKILRGASPAELPVERPSRIALVVNLKTARALGLTLPQSIMVRADRVIE